MRSRIPRSPSEAYADADSGHVSRVLHIYVQGERTEIVREMAIAFEPWIWFLVAS
jgi:hypothetical protein